MLYVVQLTGMFIVWRVLDLPGNSAELTAPGGREMSNRLTGPAGA